MLRKLHLHLRILSVFLIMAALIAGMAGCDGDDYSRNLEIRDWYDLDDVRDNREGHHTLMNNLDSTTRGYTALASPTAHGGKGWEPIGGFAGSFDGQGYEIRNLFVDRPDESRVGLFGSVYGGGVIQNIGMVNADVTGERHVGGLAGYSSGDVSNSYFTGSVTGELSVGGLVGDRSGTISNSYYNYDDVLINGDNIITRGALFDKDFEQWLANDKFLDFNERLSQEDGYYLVNNVTDFKELLAFGENATLKFRLKSDLDLGDDPNFYIPCLAGEFDGNGHKISNLSFNFDFVSHVGLFGYLAPGGKVTQVGVENLNITGTRHVGGLVGWNYGGTVSDCYATGSVTGSATRPELGGYEEYVGGLVGHNNQGTISNSYFTGSVSGLRSVGGLVGHMGYGRGNVSNSHFTGSVVGMERVGGLVGYNFASTVSNSYSSANVTGQTFVGGLVGTQQMFGTVINCCFTGNVGGYYAEWGLVGWAIGGLVGSHLAGTVSNSYSTGNVTGRIYVGGLVGWNHAGAGVYNSYSTGNVTGDEYVGGLAGQNGGTVSNSYSTGSVTGSSDVGGLVGYSEGEDNVSNSFWDTDTSGQSTSAGGTGKTTEEMQDIDTFSGAGWNIIAVGGPGERNPAYIWNIPTTPKDYPFLSWQS